MRGIFITGTDTNVGKTWVGVKILNGLKANNIPLIVRKPIESGWPDNIEESDAWKLANAVGQLDRLDQVCPFRFKAAISPDRAASMEGQSLTLKEIIKKVTPVSKNQNEFMYFEGAGGFYSPFCSDALNADLAKSLALPVLLVVENRLGCINQALLSIKAIRDKQLGIKAIVLNDVHKKNIAVEGMDNYEDLKSYTDIPVFHFKHSDDSAKSVKKLCALLV